jgi:hypothetical protein
MTKAFTRDASSANGTEERKYQYLTLKDLSAGRYTRFPYPHRRCKMDGHCHTSFGAIDTCDMLELLVSGDTPLPIYLQTTYNTPDQLLVVKSNRNGRKCGETSKDE